VRSEKRVAHGHTSSHGVRVRTPFSLLTSHFSLPSRADERAAPFPCDGLLPEADERLFRAVAVDAPAPIVFRWLCQLRAAPYSYDWLDNGGRQSPRRLTRGLDDLAVGQRVMYIFRLADFARDRHLTLTLRGPWAAVFGEAAITYRVVPSAPDRSRVASSPSAI
jgi:hypothetical protein